MSPELDGDIAKLYTDQREVYTRFAPQSFSWWYIEKPTLDRLLQAVLSPTAKAVDAGCGVGRTIKYLIEAGIAPANVLGIDINPNMLTTTHQAVPAVNLMQADIEHLPLPSNSQDLVLSTHVLHYVDNHKYLATMKSFQRILKPGGTLFVIVTHPVRTARGELSQYFHRRWITDQTPWGTEAPFFLRPISDLVNLALTAGFTLQSLDEPEVDPAGQEANPAEYQRYTTYPPRLALKFRK